MRLDDLLRLERDLTLAHAVAVRDVLAKPKNDPQGEIGVVGFHGHTIRHLAAEQLSWQLGDPSVLAEELGLPVAADFRRRDLAAGGEGAPLAPLYHQALLADAERPCVVLNLGGVGNMTWLGERNDILASDTGPDADCSTNGHLRRRVCRLTATEGSRLPGESMRTESPRPSRFPFLTSCYPRADRYDFDDAIDLDGLTAADGSSNALCIHCRSGLARCRASARNAKARLGHRGRCEAPADHATSRSPLCESRRDRRQRLGAWPPPRHHGSRVLCLACGSPSTRPADLASHHHRLPPANQRRGIDHVGWAKRTKLGVFPCSLPTANPMEGRRASC